MNREGMTSLKKDILDENIRKYSGNEFFYELGTGSKWNTWELDTRGESVDMVDPAITWAESQSSQTKRRVSFNYMNHAVYF